MSTTSVSKQIDATFFHYQAQDELDNLNVVTDRIKKLESELDEARSDFTSFLGESSATVKNFSKELKSCVKKAKKNREVGRQVRKFLTEAKDSSDSLDEIEDSNEIDHENMLHIETEKIVNQLQQELKKSINKSCLSTRRNLLKLNNIANQHQLQLLPYFEMKTQFNQMFQEEMEKVPPLDVDDMKIKMDDFDENFHFDELNGENWFQNTIDDESSGDIHTKTSNSVTSSYQDSLSSENLYLEHLTLEDLYMELPPSIKLTPGLVNCTVSSTCNSYFKSSNCHPINTELSKKNLSGEVCSENFFLKSNGQHNESLTDGSSSLDDLNNINYLASNGFNHDNKELNHINYSNDSDADIKQMLGGIKFTDSEASDLNLNNAIVLNSNKISDSESVSSAGLIKNI